MNINELQLGAIPLSPDILGKANIGLWAFELDEGKAPRMYADETMLRLIGLEHQVSPEETYHAWYDHIDIASYGLVAESVEKMTAGKHAEVQYPWHHPDGHTMIVRCGGVRNPLYTKGVRIEGTHRDVTDMLHFDEDNLRLIRQQEIQIRNSQLRADSLAFLADHDGGAKDFIDFFGDRILSLAGCDQVIFRDMNGNRTVYNAPGVSDVFAEICSRCPFSNPASEVYRNKIVQMDDCSLGFEGIHPEVGCQAKSSVMQHVYTDGKLSGLLTFHYLKEKHAFTEDEISMLKTIAVYLGLLLGRVSAKMLEQKNKEIEIERSANAAKTLFLNSMSHDIRTPMNAILGYASMAQKHIDERDLALGYLKKIGIAGNNLLELVNQVLDMSRIESGKMALSEEPADVVERAREMVEIMGSSARAKNISLKLKVIGVRNPGVYIDAGRMNQVIMNIIGNAIKYTPEGGDILYTVEQLESSEPGKGTYRFSVKDNGIGMSEEFITKIFEPFSRENTSTVSKIQGTGLGMSIVKRLVDLMGGTVSVESKHGKGTKISVTISMRLKETESSNPVEEEGAADKALLKGKRVLLVEDNEMNREIATMLLEEQGIVVESVEDGYAAIDKIRAVAEKADWEYYDFVLMDIQMPGITGYEATREIRSIPTPEGVHLPIIAMTANAFAEDRKLALEAGMDDHLAKPIDIESLWETLVKYV